jgi:hypothetical protein
MAGGLNAHTNPFVEAWGFKREHIEKTFRFTPKALSIIALAGVVFPYFIYKTSVREFVRAPRRARRAAPRSRGRRAAACELLAGGARARGGAAVRGGGARVP